MAGIPTWTPVRNWDDDTSWKKDHMTQFLDDVSNGLAIFINGSVNDAVADKAATETISGDWTFTGAVVFSSTLTLSAAVTFSGNNTFTGSNTFQNTSTFNGNISSSGTNTWSGGQTFSSSILATGSNYLAMLTPGYVNNLGLTYSSSTLTVTQADGSALAATTPGYVAVPSTTAGQLVVLKVTATDHLFVDDGGSSDIAGEEFGVTTGVEWGTDRLFNLYVVNSDDTDNGLEFAISPDPTLTTSPATANSGYHGNPAATPSDSNFFYLTATDVTTTHDAKPCVCIGSIRMQMSASDDWTVQTLTNSDGIGKFHESTEFTMPLAQMGAATGTFFHTNGGTAPVFTTNAYKYYMRRTGEVHCVVDLDGDGGANGAGAVTARISLPYAAVAGTNTMGTNAAFISYSNGTNDILGQLAVVPGETYMLPRVYTSTSAFKNLDNGDFSSGARTVRSRVIYQAFKE